MPITASLKSKIHQMMNDGLSNREILKEINNILRSKGKDTLHYAALCKIINSLMDEITFSSDEEDSEYVPSESEEDSEYVPSEDEESEEESASSDDSADESASEDSNLSTPVNPKKFHMYLNHPECDEVDRLTVEPIETGFIVRYEFNRSPTQPAGQIHEFEADSTAVLEYLSDIFCLLSIDQKPFTEIEFLIPFYPNISITPSNCNSIVCATILRVVSAYLDHYN